MKKIGKKIICTDDTGLKTFTKGKVYRFANIHSKLNRGYQNGVYVINDKGYEVYVCKYRFENYNNKKHKHLITNRLYSIY